ncbi:hypothetical protein JCM11251_003131 [Rhodosporidiobolus azoricus]
MADHQSQDHVEEPTAVLTEETAKKLSLNDPSTPAAEQPQGEQGTKTHQDKTPTSSPPPRASPAPSSRAVPTLSSPSPSPSPSSTPSTSRPQPSPSSSTTSVPPSSRPPAPQSRPSGQGAVPPPRRPAGAPGAGGALKAGVRGGVGGGGVGGPLKMPPSLAAKMAAMTSRSSSSQSINHPSSPSSVPSLKPSSSSSSSSPTPPALAPRPGTTTTRPTGALSGTGAGQKPMGGLAAKRRLGPGASGGLTLSAMGVNTKEEGNAFSGPSSLSSASSSVGAGQQQAPPAMRMGGPGGLSARRGGGMKLPGSGAGGGDGQRSPTSSRGGMGGDYGQGQGQGQGGTPFSNFRKIVDPSGRLNFASKAILHADGVDFSSGASFKIKMDDFELFEELGKGNYGTVQKVLHRPTGVTMALKEIRLELDDSKLKTIITELDILHRATSPFIIDFYGAFFIESCVYYCMEYMDAGSLDYFAGTDIPEDVLARITRSMVEGLRFLKDELKIMHRDVKPTNVLLNKKGFVKLCDFGVSGQLDRSLAKTNIGCQSYMAPERIKGESLGAATSYTASSDVWSLGLSIIEAAIGHYPYPPETYQNVFAQLTAIVHGDPPSLPGSYSETARDFVAQCLIKRAQDRPSYGQLMQHPFLAQDVAKGPDGVDMLGWIDRATAYREKHPKVNVPALA